MNKDKFYDVLEKLIAKIQNQDYANPYAQTLLDQEADMVLQDYYASPEYLEVCLNENIMVM